MNKLEEKNKKNIFIGETKDKGKAYFAKKKFKKGELVYKFKGRIVRIPSDYTIPIGSGLFIDPTDYGGKYTNDYGENANLGIKNRTELVAIREIKKSEEIGPAYFMLVPFYMKNSTGDRLKLSCFENLSENEKEKYKKYISDYLFNKKEIDAYKKFMEQAIKIRRMQVSDISYIFKIGEYLKEFKTGPNDFGFWSKKQLKKWILSKKDSLFVAELHKKIIGFVMFAHHVPTGKAIFENAWVDKGFRGKIVEKLVNVGINDLRKKGVVYVCGLPEINNIASIKFLEKNKFIKGFEYLWMDRKI